uniref:E4 protein n=1 Tax=human papillomavirus 101 TaxID=915425 RepID=A0A7G2A7D6_9PAPI|nr:E4 protein [human papillomavirus 101]
MKLPDTTRGGLGDLPKDPDRPPAHPRHRRPKATPLGTIPEGDESNKENINPNDPGGDPSLLSSLLHQWGKDIDCLIDTIVRDLQDYKTRLGIHQ